jgi:hypothetical protein
MINAKQQFISMFNALGWFFLVSALGVGGLRMLPTPGLAQLRVTEGTLSAAQVFTSNRGGKWLELKVKTADQTVVARVQVDPDGVDQKLKATRIGGPIKIWVDGDTPTAEVAQVQVKNDMVLDFPAYHAYHANDRKLMEYAVMGIAPLGVGLLLLSRRMRG